MWKYGENGDTIILDSVPKRRLKVTGTRLAGILGLNKWTTPFQMWCEITKCARPPFEDTIYTIAGKAIEPKQISYTKDVVSNYILSPKEFFGNRYQDVKYDFYPEEKIFGGMWDAKSVMPSGKTATIFEYKTTKRAEDWLQGPPTYYLIQALEYAYLEGIKTGHRPRSIVMVVSFLEENDYNNPQDYEVNNENTQMFSYPVNNTFINIDTGDVYISEDRTAPVGYFDIDELIDLAESWYDRHINSGISPKFDETKDKEYLDILRTTSPSNDNDVNSIVARANEIIKKIEEIKASTNLDSLEKELKSCEKAIKDDLIKSLGDNDTKAVIGNYTLSKTVKKIETIDKEQMEIDGVLDRYITFDEKETYTLRKKK